MLKSQLSKCYRDTSPYIIVLGFCYSWSWWDGGELVQDGSEGMLMTVLMHVLMLMNQAVRIRSGLLEYKQVCFQLLSRQNGEL